MIGVVVVVVLVTPVAVAAVAIGVIIIARFMTWGGGRAPSGVAVCK